MIQQDEDAAELDEGEVVERMSHICSSPPMGVGTECNP
jgi:hypothetical protein